MNVVTRDWSAYAIGGAQRPDSFSSMTPVMQEGLWALLQAADQEIGQGLQVYSGYRSPDLQAQLFQNALAKYGSEAAARKWVAPPGRSRHNTGQAADLKYNGVRIDQLPEDHPVRLWLSENVSRFGLAQPMSWEPWQVEVAGARGQASAPNPPVEQQQNALAETQVAREPQNALQPRLPQQRSNQLDVRQFLTAPRPVNKLAFT